MQSRDNGDVSNGGVTEEATRGAGATVTSATAESAGASAICTGATVRAAVSVVDRTGALRSQQGAFTGAGV